MPRRDQLPHEPGGGGLDAAMEENGRQTSPILTARRRGPWQQGEQRRGARRRSCSARRSGRARAPERPRLARVVHQARRRPRPARPHRPGADQRPQPSRISGIIDTRVDTIGRQRHRVEELRRHLAPRVAGVALGHRDHVRRLEVARHLVRTGRARSRGRPGSRAEPAAGRRRRDRRRRGRAPRPGGRGRPPRRRGRPRPCSSRGVPRNSTRRSSSMPSRFRGRPRVGAARAPRVGVAHVRDEDAAEALLEKSRGHRDRVGGVGRALHQPRPGQPRGVAEVERATHRAPEPPRRKKPTSQSSMSSSERAPTPQAA